MAHSLAEVEISKGGRDMLVRAAIMLWKWRAGGGGC